MSHVLRPSLSVEAEALLSNLEKLEIHLHQTFVIFGLFRSSYLTILVPPRVQRNLKLPCSQ